MSKAEGASGQQFVVDRIKEIAQTLHAAEVFSSRLMKPDDQAAPASEI